LLRQFTGEHAVSQLYDQIGAPPSIKATTPLYAAAKEGNMEKLKALVTTPGTDLISLIKVVSLEASFVVVSADLRGCPQSDPDWHPLHWCMDKTSRDKSGHLTLEVTPRLLAPVQRAVCVGLLNVLAAAPHGAD
jgi:hypothetical protein